MMKTLVMMFGLVVSLTVAQAQINPAGSSTASTNPAIGAPVKSKSKGVTRNHCKAPLVYYPGLGCRAADTQ